jgi:hypothetical protein
VTYLGQRSLSSFLLVLLNVMWYLMAALLVITVILVIGGANVALDVSEDGPNVEVGSNVSMGIPVAFTLDDGTHPIRAPALGIEHAWIERSRGSLKFPARRGPFFTASVAILLGAVGLFLWVLAQLRSLLRTVRDGQPFVPANVSRVRRIGWALILGDLAGSAILFFERTYVARHFSATGLTFSAGPELNTTAIICGLIILVIAEVFREGTRLDEERSLTI